MRILDNLTSYSCFHGGPVTVVKTNNRVKAEGSRYLLRYSSDKPGASDTFLVIGCTFNVFGSPSPCVRVTWSNQSKRVKIMGVPVLLESSVGIGRNAAGVAQGPVRIMGPQSRAKAL
jgi:hypothetical protein